MAKIYVIIGKDAKGKWNIEPDGIGSLTIPMSRFSKAEAVQYCTTRNGLVSRQAFGYVEVEVKLPDKKSS